MSNRRGRRLASRSARGRHDRPLAIVRPATEQPRPHDRPDGWELLEQAASASLDEDEPGRVLYVASALIEVARQGDAAAEVLACLVDGLFDQDQPWSAVVATAVQALCELPSPTATRRATCALPAWSAHLRTPRIVEVIGLSHVLGDWHLYLLEVEWTGADPVTVVVASEHGDPPSVEEVWMLLEPLDEARQVLLDASPLDTIDAPISPADARVRIARALEGPLTGVLPALRGEVLRLRPLLEHLLASMPEGGLDHPAVDWSEASSAEVADRCLRSPWGLAVDDEERRSLLRDLLTDAWEAGRDPMRWSGRSVADAMSALEWADDADPLLVQRTADCLRALVRWSHAELGVPAPVTAQVLAVLDVGRADQLHRIALEALEDAREDDMGGVYG